MICPFRSKLLYTLNSFTSQDKAFIGLPKTLLPRPLQNNFPFLKQSTSKFLKFIFLKSFIGLLPMRNSPAHALSAIKIFSPFLYQVILLQQMHIPCFLKLLHHYIFYFSEQNHSKL